MLTKNIPIGISNFAKLVDQTRNYVFVDKSLFIKAIIDDKSEVTLITRPRRWGKTLNMSMLYHFFAIEIPNVPTQGLFSGLEIEHIHNGQYMQHNRQYPVIFVSLKDISAKTFKNATAHVHALIRRIFGDHGSYLLASTELDNYDKQVFTHYLQDSLSEGELQDALLILSKLLFKHYQGKKVYLLIDEYDSPLNAAHKYHYIADMVNFMKGLSPAL